MIFGQSRRGGPKGLEFNQQRNTVIITYMILILGQPGARARWALAPRSLRVSESMYGVTKERSPLTPVCGCCVFICFFFATHGSPINWDKSDTFVKKHQIVAYMSNESTLRVYHSRCLTARSTTSALRRIAVVAHSHLLSTV
jgi:hypothetical protein